MYFNIRLIKHSYFSKYKRIAVFFCRKHKKFLMQAYVISLMISNFNLILIYDIYRWLKLAVYIDGLYIISILHFCQIKRLSLRESYI